MKRCFAPSVVLLAAIWVAATLLPPRNPGAFDLAGFGRLPVLADGRVKPLDTVARTSILVLQGRQRVALPSGREITPVEWLLDVLYRPELADAYKVFRIDNSEVLSLFNLGPSDGEGGVRFSYLQLSPGLDELDRQAKMADGVDASARTAFQRAVLSLREAAMAYTRLKFTLQPPLRRDFSAELADAGRVASDRASWETMDTYASIRAIPSAAEGGWETAGRALLEAGTAGIQGSTGVPPVPMDKHGPEARAPLEAGAPLDAVQGFAALGDAWRAEDAAAFNRAVAAAGADRFAVFPTQVRRCALEAWFNLADPFTTSLDLFVLTFLLAAFSWLRWPEELGRAAFGLMGLAFLLATAGVLARMWIEARPPVTNLYSSALFVGWGASGLCLILERIYRNGVAAAAGSLIGFGTLVIAHHLSLSGDTMEMMRAVLDSNFWLSSHVVTVTSGYAATFLAGFLALIYIVRGTLTRSLDRGTADSLARMVYGIVCFATFFSFIGTVLGGIWADQSWGRFWGWDPKENGALLIVLWNAVILHARWGGLVRQRGLMALAVAGNIVTAWSWFGTNMLGIGLHSYGFTEAAFNGLVGFVASQLLVVGLAAIPPAKWRSRLAVR